MSEKETKEKLVIQSKKHLPEVLVNLFVALLIWLFGVLVFLPTAIEIFPQLVPLAIDLIVLIAFTLFISRAFDSGFLVLLNSMANVLAYNYKKWKKTETSIDKLQEIVRNITYIVVMLVFYFFYSVLLQIIHPALNGLMLILIILWIFLIVLKSVNILLQRNDM
ncbi:MAG: hypothetical protein P8Y18_00140 [Candidatus Bathyarchaeota archaeon]